MVIETGLMAATATDVAIATATGSETTTAT
jgi:hypothetical protein